MYGGIDIIEGARIMKIHSGVFDALSEWRDEMSENNNVSYIFKGNLIQLIESEEILVNDLMKAACIYISEEDCAALEQCRKVYPA